MNYMTVLCSRAYTAMHYRTVRFCYRTMRSDDFKQGQDRAYAFESR